MGGIVVAQSPRWKLAGASVIGSQHRDSGGRCEDAWSSVRRKCSDCQEILSVCVCDGAGSTSHGWLGARVSSRVLSSWLADNFDSVFANSAEDNRWAICSVAKRAIRCLAGKAELLLRDYACTVVAIAANTDGRWIAVHLGDGAIIGRFQDGLRPISFPRKGEFANETFFITDEDAAENLEVKLSVECDTVTAATAFALFTDGVEVTLVNRHTRQVAPALAHMLDWLVGHAEDEVSQDLEEQLKSVFQQRTGDDCTLAMMVDSIAKAAESNGLSESTANTDVCCHTSHSDS